jgi:diaminopropionate ammonia-lyase
MAPNGVFVNPCKKSGFLFRGFPDIMRADEEGKGRKFMEELEFLRHTPGREPLPDWCSEEAFDRVRAYHRALPGYQPTPLVSLPALARRLGVRNIYLKDESRRFGLNAFKALGASWAVDQALQEDPSICEIVTATDGNHGRAVAWAARRHGKKAVIWMPAGSAECRVRAIRSIGNAEVRVTDCGYNDTVRMALAYAGKSGACLVQDTSFEGYRRIPRNIVLGYSTMAAEALEQMQSSGEEGPTHVFLQAGVGSMAGGVTAFLVNRLKEKPPCFAILEAACTACIFESVRQNQVAAIGGTPQTAMAGLNCGEPNIDTLPLLKSYAEFFARCPDEVSFEGMRRLAKPYETDPPVVSGESGAVGLGVCMRLTQDDSLAKWKEAMGLNETSVILLFSTEGDTDPEHYQKIVGEEAIR